MTLLHFVLIWSLPVTLAAIFGGWFVSAIFRLSPQVYKYESTDRTHYYVKARCPHTGRISRGHYWRWQRVRSILWGLWVMDGTKEPFWLDDMGFEKI